MRVLALFFAIACFAIAQPAQAAQSPGQLEFAVTRNGEPFGAHRVTVTRNGEELVVRNAVTLRASLGPIVLFRYEHTCTERWNAGALSGLNCSTLKDGRRSQMSASRASGGLETRGPAGVTRFPLDAPPTSWWTREALRATTLIDTETGAPMRVRVTPMGRETITVQGRAVPADRYRVEGTLALDVWYDQTGRWLRCAFTARGQRIEYTLTSPLSAAPY